MAKKYNPLLKFGIQEVAATGTLEARLLALESKLSPTIVVSQPTVDLPALAFSEIEIFRTELIDPEKDLLLSGYYYPFGYTTSGAYFAGYYGGGHSGINNLVIDLNVSAINQPTFIKQGVAHMVLGYDINNKALTVSGYSLQHPSPIIQISETYDFLIDGRLKMITPLPLGNRHIRIWVEYSVATQKIYLVLKCFNAGNLTAINEVTFNIKLAYY